MKLYGCYRDIGNLDGGKRMNWEPKFEVNVEMSFKALDIDEFKEWIKELAKIQKEYDCNCTLSVKK